MRARGWREFFKPILERSIGTSENQNYLQAKISLFLAIHRILSCTDKKWCWLSPKIRSWSRRHCVFWGTSKRREPFRRITTGVQVSLIRKLILVPFEKQRAPTGRFPICWSDQCGVLVTMVLWNQNWLGTNPSGTQIFFIDACVIGVSVIT